VVVLVGGGRGGDGGRDVESSGDGDCGGGSGGVVG
jgi:hypothetical protein